MPKKAFRSPFDDGPIGNNTGYSRRLAPERGTASKPTPKLARDGYTVESRRPRSARPGDIMSLDAASRHEEIDALFGPTGLED